MPQPPAYFDEIRASAARRWEQLDADEELAAPWRQMFRQVTQTPRHVVSELLQNADDAGATWARVTIEQGSFVLKHNGADFSAADLRSLCRFGFSNKRALLTIGFRGIGFKSTFSLGPTVCLTTPSLSILFHENRFTLPHWNEDLPRSPNVTVRVAICDARREAALRLNFEQWQSAPASLLFFSSLRRVEIDKAELAAESLGAGPGGTERYKLHGGKRVVGVLLLRSSAEPFPDEALKEIRNERMNAELELPPCRVDVVLGLPGQQRAFAVLPTELNLNTPFSVNAPFVQAPDRERIRDPAISATNRWLLCRAGRLAATTMRSWLAEFGHAPLDRQSAYALLPENPVDALTNRTTPNALIRRGFGEFGSAPKILLGTDGTLHDHTDCLAVPAVALDVWTPQELRTVVGHRSSVFLAPEVTDEHRRRLVAWDWLTSFGPGQIADILEITPPPRPSSDELLVRLWALLVRTLRGSAFTWRAKRLHVVPVMGDGLLRRANQVVRLPPGGGPVVDFLAHRLSVVEQAFVKHLDEVSEDSSAERKLAAQLQRELGLHEPERQRSIIKRASGLVFRQNPPDREAAITLAHIIAKSGARPPDGFRWLCQDGSWREYQHGLLADVPDQYHSLLPDAWRQSRLLHDAYFEPSDACSGEDWLLWLRGPSSQSQRFPGPTATVRKLGSRSKLEHLVRKRGGEPPTAYHYKSDRFELIDWEFDDELWAHWRDASRSDAELWPRVVRAMFAHMGAQKLLAMKQLAVRNVGYSKKPKLDVGDARAGWVARLQEIPCLPDRNEKPAIPAVLHRFTSTTAPLQGVERFVSSDLDTPELAPVLDLLGVHSTPADAERIVDRIRALAGHVGVPTTELIKWYTVLDRMTPTMQPELVVTLSSVFAEEPLILTAEQNWHRSDEVFVWPDDEMDGLPTVLSGTRELGFWRRIGVRERPTSTLVLQRLQDLPLGEKLVGEQLAWVRKALARLGEQVWNDSERWLAASGHWHSIQGLRWGATRDESSVLKSLFPHVREKVADMRMIGAAQRWDSMPVSVLDALSWKVTQKEEQGAPRVPPSWFRILTECLCRSVAEDQRARLAELFNSEWQSCTQLQVAPFLASEPAGESVAREVAWENGLLFVRDDLGEAQIAECMVDEITRLAPSPLARAIRVCVFRNDAFVRTYFNTHFDMSDLPSELLTDPSRPGIPDQVRVEMNDESEPLTSKSASAAQVQGEAGAEELHEQPDKVLCGFPEAQRGVQGASEGDSDKVRRERTAPVDIYAIANGYVWDADVEAFRHPDGTSISRLDRREMFQWRVHNEAATVDLWVADRGTLERGVVVPVEIWEALKARGDTALVCIDGDGARLLSGRELFGEIDEGTLVLFPASYRLRRDS